MIDLTGQRYGRLTIISDTGERAHGGVVWFCRCDCGKETRVSSNCLRKKNGTKSCGCYRAEVCSAIARSALKPRHGHARRESTTSTYQIWDGMLQRCNNPKHKAFKDYGGRGIRVCERWHCFDNFLADMGERPGDLTLDRINNDGNYEPSNCQWADRAQQSKNSRRWQRDESQARN